MPQNSSSQPSRRCLAIVLAAGEGTRMRSAKTKVLHEVAHLSMLGHVLKSVRRAGADAISVVIGPDRDDVAAQVARFEPDADVFVQHQRLGTAHAALAAQAAIARGYDDILICFADTPLIQPETLDNMRGALRGGAAVVVLGFETNNPAGYGRLVTQNGGLVAIREHKDATEAERLIRQCNAGLMALDGSKALEIITQIKNHNAQSEFYLTDAVEVARAAGLPCAYLLASESEVMGVNDRVQLAAAEREFQNRARLHWMREGVTMHAPDTVYFAEDTQLARDVTLEPNVVFGPGVTVAEGVVIHANSHLHGAKVGKNAHVGPFARLRPGSDLGADTKVGNFVETKSAKIAEGAKVSHLSYIGDATIGPHANIGAGTITCNYDGFSKFKTTIGAGAFVGSNSSLVAPVTIADGAYIGSGSVITKDVAADSLAVARGRQVEIPLWAAKFRAKQSKKDR